LLILLALHVLKLMTSDNLTLSNECQAVELLSAHGRVDAGQ